MLEGPTAIAFIESSGDPAAVAKALAATAKETERAHAAWRHPRGQELTGADVDQLAKLPPVDVLRGQLVGAIVAPLTQLLGLVSATASRPARPIDARIKQLEEQGEVVAPSRKRPSRQKSRSRRSGRCNARGGRVGGRVCRGKRTEDSAAAEASDSDEVESTTETETQEEE